MEKVWRVVRVGEKEETRGTVLEEVWRVARVERGRAVAAATYTQGS